MSDIYIKNFLKEDNTWFYIHFRDGQAVQQIEISPQGKIFLDLEASIKGTSMLSDQAVEEADADTNIFITS